MSEPLLEDLRVARLILLSHGLDVPAQTCQDAIDELTRLRASNAELLATMKVFASDDGWRFERSDVGGYYGSRNYDEWVWDEPWMPTGVILYGDYQEKKPVKNPQEFAKAAIGEATQPAKDTQ
jgi:hypothetical protein